jgi:hypothetical protein
MDLPKAEFKGFTGLTRSGDRDYFRVILLKIIDDKLWIE